MGLLLFDYLVHEGFWETADRVAQDILLGRAQVSQQVCHLLPSDWQLNESHLV